MKLWRLLSGTGLLTTLAALMPGAASASLIQIDESIEGHAPTASTNFGAISNFSATAISEPSGIEAWTIAFNLNTIIFTGTSIGGGEGGLIEPGTTRLSDLMNGLSVTLNPNTLAASVRFTLFSDNNSASGGLGSCPAGVTCPVEDGTFQTVIPNAFTLTGGEGPLTYDIQLKSDLEVPEPGPLSILTGGLAALAFLRRRKKPVV